MRIRKLRGRKRKVGDIVLSGDEVQNVRECAVEVVEGYWDEADPTEPIQNSGNVSVFPSEDENVYCKFLIGEEQIDVPEKPFVLKMLRLL